VQVAARWPELFSALCGCQPSTSKAPQSYDWEENGGFEMKTEIFGKIWLPKEFFIDRLQYVTVETVKKLKIPQLYIAGSYDDLAPAQDVKKIFENANEPKQYKEFPTTHFYKEDQDVLQQVNEVTVTFFAKALLTD
jgi:pimeloyl-ACP methyl ester carboxylesterase